VAALLPLGLSSVPAAGSPAVAATAGGRPGARIAPALPAAPACAKAVAVASGGTTSAATRLPTPTSTQGGELLSRTGLHVDLPSGVPSPPTLRAVAWMITDLTTNEIIAACNAHVRMPPASTLKVLTALALRPRLKDNKIYTGRAHEANQEGTRVGIVPGSLYTARDLFHAMLLFSGNDAAEALASLVGGTAATTKLMNQKAKELGAYDTHASNASGLDALGQVSSVYDLALFGRAALADKQLTSVFRTRTYDFPSSGAWIGPSRKTFEIQSHNRLLGKYKGADGVKNGYTTQAGGTYIASATRGSDRYLVTVMRTDGKSQDAARDLLDWAFSHGGKARAVGRLARPAAAPGKSASPKTTGSASPSTAAPADRGSQDGGSLLPLAVVAVSACSVGLVFGLVSWRLPRTRLRRHCRRINRRG
jgi:serine-type D-Ala-D-Ala carboxypeptidase (penicillin-binding protein 5/6)